MKNSKKEIKKNIAPNAIAAAIMAITANVNSTCMFVAYQFKLLKGTEKFRRI